MKFLGYWIHRIRGCHYYGGTKFDKWTCKMYDGKLGF